MTFAWLLDLFGETFCSYISSNRFRKQNITDLVWPFKRHTSMFHFQFRLPVDRICAKEELQEEDGEMGVFST